MSLLEEDRAVDAAMDAAKAGDTQPLAQWLQTPDASTRSGHFARHMAMHDASCYDGTAPGSQHHAAVLRMLLLHDADNFVTPKVLGDKGSYFMNTHAFFGNIEMCSLLVEHGVDVRGEAGGYTPLHRVTDHKRPSVAMMRFLLKNGADPFARWEPNDEEKEDPDGQERHYMTAEDMLLHALEHRDDVDPVYGWRLNAELVDECYHDCIALLSAVREAGGYRQYVNSYVIVPHKDLLVLRTLAARGRAKATPATPPHIASLFSGLPDGVFWNVLEYWLLAY